MGASGAMSNGTILARAGSASVAMVADAMQRPVIICCETLKFVDRVQLDSITYNELGNPDTLATIAGRAEPSALQSWQDQAQLGEPFEHVIASNGVHAMQVNAHHQEFSDLFLPKRSNATQCIASQGIKGHAYLLMRNAPNIG